MIKKLVKHGNSLALVIDRPVLELLKIDPDTPLEVETDGQALNVRPIRAATAGRKKEIREALEIMDRKYGRMLKRLAE